MCYLRNTYNDHNCISIPVIIRNTSAVRSAFVLANDRERSVIQPITGRQLPNVRGRSLTKQLTELTADPKNTSVHQ